MNGEINADKPNVKLVLDQSILNELNLIPEANIVENEGSPAYVIKGNVYSDNASIIERTIPKAFKSEDLYRAFLDQKCNAPDEYIKNICFQQSYYYPIYFFIKLSGKDNSEIIKYLTSIRGSDVKMKTKASLIKKIKNNVKEKPLAKIIKDLKVGKVNIEDLKSSVALITQKNELKGNREVAVIRTIIYSYIIAEKEVPEIFINKYLKEVIEAITALDQETIKKSRSYVLSLSKNILKEVEDREDLKAVIKSSFKKMLCLIDQMLHN